MGVSAALRGGPGARCGVRSAGPGLPRSTSSDLRRRAGVSLAASQIATDVPFDEGLAARNITRWRGTQDRLAGSPSNSPDDDRGLRLHVGYLMI